MMTHDNTWCEHNQTMTLDWQITIRLSEHQRQELALRALVPQDCIGRKPAQRNGDDMRVLRSPIQALQSRFVSVMRRLGEPSFWEWYWQSVTLCICYTPHFQGWLFLTKKWCSMEDFWSNLATRYYKKSSNAEANDFWCCHGLIEFGGLYKYTTSWFSNETFRHFVVEKMFSVSICRF